MTAVDDLRKSIRSAQVFGSGQYILKGQHTLEVSKCFYKKANDGTNKENLICEFRVVSSTNPDMVEGETRSAVYTFDKQGWLGRFKSMTLALVGVEPDGKIPAAADEAVADIYAALLHDPERERLGLPENFLAGRRVRCEGIPGVIKKGPHAGKEIINCKWSPLR
jgi:hypothetical protein